MNECNYYKPPRLVTDPETDRTYECSAMCSLVDKYCVVELGMECEEYNKFLGEEMK